MFASIGNQTRETATIFCIKCKENMCALCSSIHGSMRITKSHTITPLEYSHREFTNKDNAVEKCEIHQTRDITYYCSFCSSVACEDCMEEKHSGYHHTRDDIIEASQLFKDDLQTRCDTFTNKLADLKNQFEKCSADSCLFAKSIIDVQTRIKGQGENIKQIVDKHVEHAIKSLKLFGSKIQREVRQDIRHFVKGGNCARKFHSILQRNNKQCSSNRHNANES